MPQWPQYWKNTERDLKDLDNLLGQMMRYGFIHEDLYPNIDKVMAELYHDAVRKYAEVTFGVDNDEDLADSPLPQFIDLFAHVDSDQKPQFIQDLRNTINSCIYSQTWSINGVADEIRNARDIEAYHSCSHEDI